MQSDSPQTPASLLLAYLKKQRPKITNAAFGAQIGVTGEYISMLKRGKCRCSHRVARLIEVATGGAVPASAWDADLVLTLAASSHGEEHDRPD